MKPTDISMIELTTGFRYNAAQTYYSKNVQNRYIERFAASPT